MSIFNQIVLKIIREQELLVGPVAWSEAGRVSGLKIIDQKKGMISIEEGKDESVVVNNLVGRFETLFGRAGKEVCKEAVGALVGELQPGQIPSSLL